MLGMPWTSATVYIGRGSKAHGLAASVWGNRWKVSAVGRDAAIAKYKDYLKTLVCRCDDLDRCHGETITEAFEMAVAKQNKVVTD